MWQVSVRLAAPGQYVLKTVSGSEDLQIEDPFKNKWLARALGGGDGAGTTIRDAAHLGRSLEAGRTGQVRLLEAFQAAHWTLLDTGDIQGVMPPGPRPWLVRFKSRALTLGNADVVIPLIRAFFAAASPQEIFRHNSGGQFFIRFKSWEDLQCAHCLNGKEFRIPFGPEEHRACPIAVYHSNGRELYECWAAFRVFRGVATRGTALRGVATRGTRANPPQLRHPRPFVDAWVRQGSPRWWDWNVDAPAFAPWAPLPLQDGLNPMNALHLGEERPRTPPPPPPCWVPPPPPPPVQAFEPLPLPADFDAEHSLPLGEERPRTPSPRASCWVPPPPPPRRE